MAATLGQSLGATLGQLAFGGNTREKELKGMLDGAHAGAYDASRENSLASALKARMEAEALARQAEMQKPEAIFRNAATQYGIPEIDLPAVRDFQRTGQLGGRFAAPADGVGPPMERPAWQANLPALGRTIANTSRAVTLGDKSVKNVAEAEGSYQDQDIVSQAAAAAGRGDDMALSRLNALRGKKEFAPFKAVGNTGTTVNEVIGTQGVSNAPMNQLFTQGERAQINQRNAAAGASNASADSSRASAAKTKLETEQGGRTGNVQIVTDANGNVTLVDKATGLARPATYADGKTVGAKAAATNGGTEGEKTSAGYAERMTAAEKIIGEVAAQSPKAQKPNLVEQATGGIGMTANLSRDESRQQYRQAQEDWVRAKLRKESGAVIADAEMEREISVYFPQIGDGPKVVKQKTDARKVAEAAMRKAAGRAASPVAPATQDKLSPAEQQELNALRARFQK